MVRFRGKPVYLTCTDLRSRFEVNLHNNNNNNNNTANRTDIKIKNKKEKTCTLLDVAIPADRKVVQKEAEKKLKNKTFKSVIPVVLHTVTNTGRVKSNTAPPVFVIKVQ